MTKDEMLRVLKDSFKDFKFYEDGHYYECKGKRVGVSVTTFIHEYCNEFDELGMAEKSAIKNNKSVQEILDEWHYKRDFSCEKGTTCHEFAQALWSRSIYNPLRFDNSEEYKMAVAKIRCQAINFHEDYSDTLEHLIDELPIGSEEFNIASCCDHLFYNKLTGGLVLVDYKTNTDIYKDKKYYENARKKPPKMKIPLQHLEDLTITHYYIQLSIYKFLIEKYTGLKVDEMFIVYMSENIENYEIIPIPYLKKEVEMILENRRVKEMNSVPVLLIGQSGSGKSTSLRNFTKEEVAVVNVLGKPLPFKSDIKAPKCDDYASILKAIAGTKKKTIVIDDANYLITNEFMNKSSVKGFDKYNEMGNNFFNLINGIKNIEGGKTVYLIMHEDTDENGNIKPKTIGKLLDDKVNIQGMFTVCIRSMFDNGNYIFRLKTNGQDCVKTPFGMFETETMENDLKQFDKVVREYYDLDKIESEEK
jgi:hypothetical protein